MRNREVGREQVVGPALGHLHPERHATQVLLAVSLAGALGIRKADRGRIRFSGLGEAGTQVLGQVVDEAQLRVPGREHGLGMEGALHGRRPGVPLGLQLDRHDVPGQLLEEQALGFGATALVNLAPLGHSALAPLRGWILLVSISRMPGKTPCGVLL